MAMLLFIEKLMKSLIILDKEPYLPSILFKETIATKVFNIGSKISEKIFSKK